MKYTLICVPRGDLLDDLHDDFGRRIGKGEFSNKKSAGLVLLKVSLDKVDSGIDLDFLSLLLFFNFERVFGDFFKAVRKHLFGQRQKHILKDLP
jgi:hypothetical protein